MGFRDNSASSTALLILAGLLTALQVTCSILAIPANSRYALAEQHGEDPTSIVTAFDVASLVVVAVTVATWIACALWLGSAYDNARAISPQNLRRSKPWVWLGWWVPVVSLWFPKTVVDDVWSTTASRVQVGAATRRTTAWWTFWVVGLLITTALTLWSLTGHTVTDVVVAIEWLLTTCTVAAFAFWVPIVRGLTRTQIGFATQGART